MRQQPATITTVTIALTLLVLAVPAIGLAQRVTSVQITQASITGGTNALVTGTVRLDRQAEGGDGLLVKLSDNADAVTVPGSVTVPPGAQVSPPFTITIGPVPVPSMVTITAESEEGGPKDARLLVLPPALNAVGLLPASNNCRTGASCGTVVTGGTGGTVPVTGRVGLTGRAPAGGFVVQLSSSNPAVATVPASVTVPAGALFSDTFPVTTFPVAPRNMVSVTITASSPGVTKDVGLTILPPVLTSVGVLPTSITGGTGVTVRVLLSGPAPMAGVNVQLSSSNPAVATVPQVVPVPAGATFSAEFPVTTSPVTTRTTVTISAFDGEVTKTVQLTVNP